MPWLRGFHTVSQHYLGQDDKVPSAVQGSVLQVSGQVRGDILPVHSHVSEATGLPPEIKPSATLSV